MTFATGLGRDSFDVPRLAGIRQIDACLADALMAPRP